MIPFRTTLEGSEFALFRRADEGYWQPIASGGERDESPELAAKRESLEEAGISTNTPFYRLDSMDMIPVSHFPALRQSHPKVFVIPQHTFAARLQAPDITLSSEHTEYVWRGYEEAFELLHWQTNKVALWELNERLGQGRLPRPF